MEPRPLLTHRPDCPEAGAAQVFLEGEGLHPA